MSEEKGLVARGLPRTKVEIVDTTGRTQFEIKKNDSMKYVDASQLEIRHGGHQVTFHPESYDSEDKQGETCLGPFVISAMQILPSAPGEYALYLGSESCCNGRFMSAKLSTPNGAEPKVTEIRSIVLPGSTIHGILGSEKQVLVYGYCGVKRITLEEMCIHDDIYTSEEVRKDSGECYDVSNFLLVNPPHTRDGKLYISYLNEHGELIFNKRAIDHFRSQGFVYWPGDDVEYVTRAICRNNRNLDRDIIPKMELCIDDKLSKISEGERIGQDIKESVDRSYFLYQHSPSESNNSWGVFGLQTLIRWRWNLRKSEGRIGEYKEK